MAVAADNERVAKNTVVLYFRMIFQMLVYLYTSRVLMNELGVVDYGLFDVVGASVAMLTFLNNSMINCTQRFITFAIGKGDDAYLKSVCSVSLFIHIFLAIVILVLGETAGLWYVENYMIIPPSRFQAALVVFHCTLLSAVLTIITVPYNAMIVAYEKMTAFAAITIADVLLKLLLVLSLPYVGGDKLANYAFLLLAETIVVRIIYFLYCRLNFKSAKVVCNNSKKLYKEMLGFAGWSTFGNFALACNTQGLNLLLNFFGGAVLNAARGAAFQVQTAVIAFTASFQTAINPQITKRYAMGDTQGMNVLVLRSSRFSFYLLLLIALPLMLETPTILELWLKNVPAHAVAFTRLLLCVTLVEAVANPMMIAVSATGKIKYYHIFIGCTLICALPLAWVLLHFTGRPAMAFVAQLAVVVAAQVVRMFFCRRLFGFSISQFLKEVVKPLLKVTTCAVIPSYVVCRLAGSSFWATVIVVIVTLCLVVLAVMCVGLTAGERKFIYNKIHLK